MSDSFCGLVRKVDKNSISIIAGHPSEKILIEPKKLMFKKDILYIMCSNGIYTFSIRDNKLSNGSIYESEKLKGIMTDESNGIYILEEQNA